MLTHLHGDHFGGLPFFLLDAQFASRREMPLVVAGPVGTGERVRRALEVFFPGSERTEWRFPLDIREIGPASPTRIGGAAVAAEVVLHPSGAPSLGLRIEAGGRTIAYSGDTEWTDRLLVLAKGADLFICECYAWAGRAPHHLDFGTLAARRGELGARRILLTHMNAEMLSHRQEVEGFDVAEDGMVMVV
ncbi:MBL fold metallo-hydrolase [Faunimonas sp. B44]|uniref:MBL fold metallo-hydrolase n=1 Tax=Faunimonas sp. B44 TaxID=3461493 RepID=UPI004043A740